MQVYPRIANPYCPQGYGGQTNAPTPFYAPGEIGCAFNDQSAGKQFLRVLLDSGATSATSIGVVAAGQIAYWKDRSNNIVTNDINFNQTGTPSSCVNEVAGIFMTAVTAAPGTTNSQGNPVQYVCDVCIQGQNVPVSTLATSGSALFGAFAIVDATTGKAKALATVTTAPTQQTLGTFRAGGVVNGLANIDVNIGFVD